MSDEFEEITPVAVSESVIDLLGIKVKVYQLDNGQRIIDADDMGRLLAIMFKDEPEKKPRVGYPWPLKTEGEIV